MATIVVGLTISWTMAEVLGLKHSLEHRPKEAPWFYGLLSFVLVAGGVLVASGANLVRLSIAAGVLNALLLPVVLGFLFLLARALLPYPLRPRGIYAAIAAIAFLAVAAVGIYAGSAGRG